MDGHPAVRDAFIKSGYAYNTHGGFYENGKAKPLEEKARVAQKYIEMKEGNPRLSIRELAKEAKVSPSFAGKVVKEFESGRLIDPNNKHSKPPGCKPKFGSRPLSVEDECVLLELRAENHQRPLIDYKHSLEQITGTVVSTSTICKWFLYSNEFKGACRALNKVPIDKWKPENVERAMEFISMVYQMNPYRFKFCDEAHLKGERLYSKRGRRCPLTGVLEPVLVGSDFRNTSSECYTGVDHRILWHCAGYATFQILLA